MIATRREILIKRCFCLLKNAQYTILYRQIKHFSFSPKLNLNQIGIISFSGPRAISYPIDHFNICLLIIYIKTLVLHKRQRFDDGKSKEMITKKHQQFDECDNKQEQGLNKNENKVKGNKYISFSPLAFFSSSEKE